MHATSGDPRAGFSDMQWFLYHQRNVVFYAAFSSVPFDRESLDARIAAFAALAPQVTGGYLGARPGQPLDRATVHAISSIEEVDSLDGLPEAWLDGGFEVFADPKLPLFRFRCANRRGGPDGEGRAGFILIRISHALVEGADSAQLTRSQPTERPGAAEGAVRHPLAVALSWIAVPLHLAAANLMPGPKGTRVFATRTFARARIAAAVRALGVRQRSVLYALVLTGLFGAGTRGGKRRVSCLYSTLDNRPELMRDGFIKMRTVQASFRNRPDFAAYVRHIDRRFSELEAADAGFSQSLNTASVHLHRRLNALMPFAYSPKVFALIPFDCVIGLIPPHYFGGPLTEDLLPPAWCGTTTPGLTSCVIVPNRETFALGLYLTPEQASGLRRMDQAYAGLARPAAARASA